MPTKYESLADTSKYFYLVKSGTTFPFGTLNKIECNPHFHKNVEFLFIVDGEQNVNIDGNNITLRKGEILFVNSYEPHSYSKSNATGYVLLLSTFYLEVFNSIYENKRFPKILNNVDKNIELFNYIREWELSLHEQSEDYFTIFIKSNKLLQIISKIYDLEDIKIHKQDMLVTNILQYIDQNYQKDISLQTCSKELNYSMEYISKIFNNTIGESFRAYLNRLRIDKYYEIKDEHMSIRKKAKICGFKSIATFYRALENNKNPI